MFETGTIKPRSEEEMRLVYERKLRIIHDAGCELSKAEQSLINKLKIEGYSVKTLEEARFLVACARRILFSSRQGIS